MKDYLAGYINTDDRLLPRTAYVHPGEDDNDTEPLPSYLLAEVTDKPDIIITETFS